MQNSELTSVFCNSVIESFKDKTNADYPNLFSKMCFEFLSAFPPNFKKSFINNHLA